MNFTNQNNCRNINIKDWLVGIKTMFIWGTNNKFSMSFQVKHGTQWLLAALPMRTQHKHPKGERQWGDAVATRVSLPVTLYAVTESKRMSFFNHILEYLKRGKKRLQAKFSITDNSEPTNNSLEKTDSWEPHEDVRMWGMTKPHSQLTRKLSVCVDSCVLQSNEI